MSCNYIYIKNKTYGQSSSSTQRQSEITARPVEVYAFLDPLSEHSWSLEPYFKKLYLEYGNYLMIRPVISRNLSVLTERNLNKLKKIWESKSNGRHFLMKEDSASDSLVLFPWVALVIKAAELQGKNSGRVFLRKIQESYFLKKKNILSESVLTRCAKAANLDINEFKNDLFSTYAKNAYQCDLKVMKEMGIDSTPTLVLFNHEANEQGVKIPGVHHYDTYVQVLKGMIGHDLVQRPKGDLHHFMKLYKITTSEEVAIVYDWPITKAVQELKKLQIQQIVEKVTKEDQCYWEYME